MEFVEGSVLEAVLSVFTGVGEWFVQFLPHVTQVFWIPADPDLDGSVGQLTFFGVLALAGLSFSVIFLLLGVISNFLHFRG